MDSIMSLTISTRCALGVIIAPVVCVAPAAMAQEEHPLVAINQEFLAYLEGYAAILEGVKDAATGDAAAAAIPAQNKRGEEIQARGMAASRQGVPDEVVAQMDAEMGPKVAAASRRCSDLIAALLAADCYGSEKLKAIYTPAEDGRTIKAPDAAQEDVELFLSSLTALANTAKGVTNQATADAAVEAINTAVQQLDASSMALSGTFAAFPAFAEQVEAEHGERLKVIIPEVASEMERLKEAAFFQSSALQAVIPVRFGGTRESSAK